MRGTCRLAWIVVYPVRLYVARSPSRFGKELAIRYLLRPLLPKEPAEFDAPVPGGGRIRLRYRETLGVTQLIYGHFEAAELAFARDAVVPGTVAIDVGANVGLFTVALADRLGTEGEVWSFEPFAPTADRLRANIAQNALSNVEVFEVAAGQDARSVRLTIGDDAAFNTTAQDVSGTAHVVVDQVRLDDIWVARGQPAVSLIKVDTEGTESCVLAGATELLATSMPTVIVEAPTAARLSAVRSVLEPLGYVYDRPPGFMRWNFVFSPVPSSSM